MAISASELYRTANIDGIMVGFVQRANSYLLGQYVPLRAYNKDVLEMDIDIAFRGGMTPISSRGAAASIYNPQMGRSHNRFEAPNWKEKIEVHSEELFDHRVIGTQEQLLSAQNLVQWKMSLLEERLRNRLEWLRKSVIFDQQVVAENDRGQVVRFKYNEHPADFRPTAATPWSDPASDPVADLQDWVEHFRRQSPFRINEVMLPIGTMRALTDVTKFQNIKLNNYAAFSGNDNAILREFQIMTSVGNIRESDDAIGASTPLVSAVVAGATDTLTVVDTYGLAVGDTVRVHRFSDRLEDLYTVIAVTDATIQLDRVVDNSFERGDAVYWNQFTIPAGKVLILGTRNRPLNTTGQQAPINTAFIDNFMEVATTLVREHNVMTTTSGLYRKTIDKTNDDPSTIQDMLGINALPRIIQGRGWMVADIG